MSVQPIIRRKKIVHGHGAHGGAWKVAYADFVTAMMAFFLVMWLMGSDEETKKEIAHYFTHPNEPYQKGGDVSVQQPGVPVEITNESGSGESILKGKPEKTMDPSAAETNPATPDTSDFREIGQLLNEVLGDQAFGVEVDVDHLKFKVPETVLLSPGTTHFAKTAAPCLSRIGKILQGFKGQVTIENHSDETVVDGTKVQTLYQTSIIKSVTIMDYLVSHDWIPEDRIQPIVEKKSASPAGNDEESTDESGRKSKYFEFTMKRP